MTRRTVAPLRRHQLARLTPGGWRGILAREWPADSRACLEHWAAHDLPLVVTRQPESGLASPDVVALGLSVPQRWGRRAMAVQVAHSELASLGEFPLLADVAAFFPASTAALLALAASLQRLGVAAHAYGSAGWQHLSGLACLHPHSDLDLWLAVADAARADAAVQVLAACRSVVRVDGELLLPDGAAVAWREWAAWRRGACTQVLVKRLHGAALEADPARGAATVPRCAA